MRITPGGGGPCSLRGRRRGRAKSYCLVKDRCSHPRLRRSRNLDRVAGGNEPACVLIRVEAGLASRDVIGDDRVSALAAQLRAAACNNVLSLGGEADHESAGIFALYQFGEDVLCRLKRE